MMIINLNKFFNKIFLKNCSLSPATIKVKTDYIIKRNFITNKSKLIKKSPQLNFQRPQRKTFFNSPYYKLAKYLFVFEAATLIATYLVWKRMNTSQEFRLYMSKSFPYILEGYYLIGESIGGLDTRNQDSKAWKNTPDPKNKN